MSAFRTMLVLPVMLLAAGSLPAPAALAGGNTHIVTETRLVPDPVPDANIVDFQSFDANGDGVLSRDEVGEKLFYTFDKDGNQLIDNIEFNRPMVLAFAPMQRKTIQYFDFDGDGIADKTAVTQEAFMAQTGLSRFSKGGAGISAADFIGIPFKTVDRNRSGQIDIREWTQVYADSMRRLPQNESFRYNR